MDKQMLATSVGLTTVEFSDALRKKIVEMGESQDIRLVKAVSEAAFSLNSLVDTAIMLDRQEE